MTFVLHHSLQFILIHKLRQYKLVTGNNTSLVVGVGVQLRWLVGCDEIFANSAYYRVQHT